MFLTYRRRPWPVLVPVSCLSSCQRWPSVNGGRARVSPLAEMPPTNSVYAEAQMKAMELARVGALPLGGGGGGPGHLVGPLSLGGATMGGATMSGVSMAAIMDAQAAQAAQARLNRYVASRRDGGENDHELFFLLYFFHFFHPFFSLFFPFFFTL